MIKLAKPPSRAQIIKSDPLGEFLVFWLEISLKDVANFRRRLEAATCEEDMQTFLQAYPMLLVQVLGGGHGRWVIPRKRLGSEYVTDFMVGERSSVGFGWLAVELESPLARMFTANGDPSRTLNHALRQISDWRVWLRSNQGYASRARSENGLGLTEIGPEVPGLILIGRRDAISPETNGRRRQMATANDIQIHSYDYLLDVARASAEYNENRRARKST